MPITNVSKYSKENNGKLSDLITLGRWKNGIVNITDKYNVPEDALLDALNVNFTNTGSVSRRDGYKLFLAGNVHSMFEFKDTLYYVKNTDLCKMNSLGTETVLRPNYTTEKVFYVSVGNEIYLSTQDKTNRINSFGNLDYWGVNSPKSECEVLIGQAGSGSLKKGIYRVNYSYMVGNYESSVYPLDTVFEVPYDNFKVDLSCIPTSQSTSAMFYISTMNGENIYACGTGYEVEVSIGINSGKLPKMYGDSIPSWKELCFANGRIWGVKGKYVYFSMDRDYRQYNPALNISIDGTDINLFKAVDNGCYVITDLGTYFLACKNPEDTANMELIKLNNDKVIKGTLFTDNKVVGWLSTNGYMVADQAGKVENRSKERIDLSKNYSSGSSIMIEKNGIRQVIFSLDKDGEKTIYQSYEKTNDL